MMSGKSSPAMFHDPKTGVRAVVHGDDFTFLGFETELQQVKRELQRSYQLKVRAILGDDVKDEKTVVILNHKLVWKENCIEYEADEQHAQKVSSGCGLESTSKGLDTPSIREGSGNHNEDDECLNPQEVKEFRGLVARANYLAQDRPIHPVCDQGSVQVSLRRGHKTKPCTKKDAPRRVPWHLAKSVYKLTNTNIATLYSPIPARATPAPTSKSPQEREFVVDSGASMHMLSKKDFS